MLRKELQTCNPRISNTRERLIMKFVIQFVVRLASVGRLSLVALAALGPLSEICGMRCAVLRRRF